MKTSFALYARLVVALGLALLVTRAPSAETLPVPELALVVVDAVQRQQGAITDFDRIDLAFTHVAKQRKWPVKIVAEQFTASTAAHDTELRVFNQPLREETSGDLTFRGWMTLTVGGTKHDFGMITYRYYRRAGEPSEDVFEKVFRGAAQVAAEKIEPILFSKANAPKA